MNELCYNCHLQTVNKLIEKFKPGPAVSKVFTDTITQLLEENQDTPNPYLATDIHRYARDFISMGDLYREEKFRANELLLNSYSKWRSLVNESADPFYAAAKLAVAGNIIDYGAHVVPEDIERQIMELFHTPLMLDEVELLKKAVKEAKHMLYLGDNAGEIIFDLSLIHI